jgi:ABC-type uncharacterized transport system permease subunit
LTARLLTVKKVLSSLAAEILIWAAGLTVLSGAAFFTAAAGFTDTGLVGLTVVTAGAGAVFAAGSWTVAAGGLVLLTFSELLTELHPVIRRTVIARKRIRATLR